MAARLLVIDPGGFLDSEAFNAQDHAASLARLAGDHRAAFHLLEMGIEQSDIACVGQAASLSAALHQQILFNPLLEKTQRIVRDIGAAGVCRAHSGTILGLLLETDCDELDLAHYCQQRLPSGVRIFAVDLVNGGVRFEKEMEKPAEVLPQ